MGWSMSLRISTRTVCPEGPFLTSVVLKVVLGGRRNLSNVSSPNPTFGRRPRMCSGGVFRKALIMPPSLFVC